MRSAVKPEKERKGVDLVQQTGQHAPLPRSNQKTHVWFAFSARKQKIMQICMETLSEDQKPVLKLKKVFEK